MSNYQTILDAINVNPTYSPEEEAYIITLHDLIGEQRAQATHSPEMVALLEHVGKEIGLDLTSYIVYYSPHGAALCDGQAKIANTFFLPAPRHSAYAVAPKPLSREVITFYALEFVSRPAREA